MSKQKGGLGRGLGALLTQPDDSFINQLTVDTSSDEHTKDELKEFIKIVDINEVEPNYEQPRKAFNEEELTELSKSILEHGIIQPLVVCEKNGKYEIVAGERRYRAARLAEIEKIPIIVKDFSEQQILEVALVENIQRSELNSMELASAYNLLMDRFDLSQEQVADKVGKSRSSIANILRLLKLNAYVQQKLRDNEISLGHAKVLLAIKEQDLQRKVADLIIEKNLSVRDTEEYIKKLAAAKEETKKNKERT